MVNFIIALFVKKEFITEVEGEKLAKSLFGHPIPGDYESCLALVDRLLKEAKVSTTRKYFDPDAFEKVTKEEKKTVTKKVAQKNK